MILTLLQNLYYLKIRRFAPPLGQNVFFGRDKMPMVVSWLILRLNWYILENTASFAWKTNPVRSDILFNFYKYISSSWALSRLPNTSLYLS